MPRKPRSLPPKSRRQLENVQVIRANLSELMAREKKREEMFCRIMTTNPGMMIKTNPPCGPSVVPYSVEAKSKPPVKITVTAVGLDYAGSY